MFRRKSNNEVIMSSENDNKKTKQSCLSILIQAIILCVTTTCLTFMSLPNHFFRRPRASARAKACFSNLRVLTGAVEMYNMDNEIIIREFDSSTTKILLENKYLKSEPVLPEIDKCKYKSNGDISIDGYLYCEYHGDVEGKHPCEYNKEYDLKEIKRNERYKWLFLFACCFGPALLLIIVNLM